MEEKLNQLTFTNAAVFGFLIAIAYYFLFYSPSNPENILNNLNEQLILAKGEAAKLDRNIKKAQEIKREIDGMEESAKKIFGQLSEKVSVQRVTAIVSQEARTVGLSIESINALRLSWEKQKTLATVDVDVRVRGEFSQIMVFLSELTRDGKIYSIDEYSIGTSQGGGDLGDELVFGARIRAYRKLSEDEMEAIRNKENGLNG